jgi:glycosyltransferase involved in cell wall biosynthesis
MKLGIIITTYNRSYYLKQCLDSLKDADFPIETTLLFVDDTSEEHSVRYIIENYKSPVSKYAIFKETNQGIHDSLKRGFDYFFNKDFDLVMNLDSDAIVAKDFIYRLLNLKVTHPLMIASGFNTLTCDPNTKLPRHPIELLGDECCYKKSIGGINIVLDKELYLKYVSDCLTKGYGWDWKMSAKVKEDNNYFVVAKPSCIQHIGIDSTFNNHTNPDIASDFC